MGFNSAFKGLNEEACAFTIISRLILLKITNDMIKICREN